MKKLIVAATCAAISMVASAATFDFEEYAGNWWYAGGHVETDGGISMTVLGRAFITDGGDGAGGINGMGMKANYAQDVDPAIYSFDQNVVVTSLDISGDDGGQTGSVYIQGMLGGVEQWRIDPTLYAGMLTYNAATSGDMSLQIDEILQHGPDDSVAGAGTIWGNNIDNINVVPEPATIGLLGVAGVALYVRRKMA